MVANILLNWTSDSQNPDTVAGLKAIQAPERTESAGATIGQSLHQGLQFSIQEYQVRGSSDIYEGIPRWYKDEGRKDESNLVLLVSIRDLQGSKLRVSQTVHF